MAINVHVHHHFGEYELRLLQDISHKLGKLMALAPEVQSLVDAVAANTSAVGSALAALQAENTQITALQAQVADLQAKLAGGTPIDAEDLAAIVKATGDLGATNTAAQAAVPQNVTTT